MIVPLHQENGRGVNFDSPARAFPHWLKQPVPLVIDDGIRKNSYLARFIFEIPNLVEGGSIMQARAFFWMPLFITTITGLLLFSEMVGSLTMAQETDSDGPTLLVNFTDGTIDGVNMKNDFDSIKAQIGEDHVKENIVVLEGQPFIEFKISFDGHVVDYDYFRVSFTDPVFRTIEGLGVGSKVKDFDQYYGIGTVTSREPRGVSIVYSSEKPRYHFSVKVVDLKYFLREKSYFDDHLVKKVVFSLGNR